MTEISTIPGVTAAEAAAMAALTLHKADDLLRIDRARLLARMPGLTRERVAGWQAFAELMHLDGIAPAEAASLRAAGADGLSEFAGWALARQRAVLPGVPEDKLLAWVRDAVRLDHTGVLNGNVRLRDGTPVEGAEARVGGDTYRTDARGRFRALRLALDRKATVSIHHPDFGHKLAQNVPVHRSGALVGQTFVLPGRAQAPKILTELKGDKLPALGSAPIATKVIAGAPDPSDILMAIDRYAGGDLRAASRFLDFAEGRFVRRVYRIPEADLPAGLRNGDDIEWTGALWALARYSAREIARKVRLRAARRRFTRAPASAAEADRRIKAILRALSDG
jgi:hypothetical protein